ncbi:hypothetical protein AVEN_264966-1, partial [Araneus ventricosus]
SGEEGVYPHLIKFCEARLQQVDPSNKYLLSAKGIMSYSDIPEEEKENILAGLEVSIKFWAKSVNGKSVCLYVRGHANAITQKLEKPDG